MRRTVIACAYGDVTGAGQMNRVNLTGEKQSEGGFYTEMELGVQNGRRPVVKLEVAGYNPHLFLGDFTGNGVCDVLITMNSGGSGGMTYDYLYSFSGVGPRKLFDFEDYNNQYVYCVNFKDCYKVEAICKNSKKRYLIDISQRGEEYLNEIYYPDGRLKRDIQGFVDPVSSLFPVDADQDGIYELLAYQQIAGQYNADNLGYFQNFLKHEAVGFELFEQQVSIYGKG